MQNIWFRRSLIVLAASSLTAVGSAQSLTTTFTNGSIRDGNMFNVIASAVLTLDSMDVHFDDGINQAPYCTGTNSCSINEVEMYYKVGGWGGSHNNSADWTLLGSVQHTISTAPGAGQPLAMNIGLPMDPVNPLTKKYALYVTNTGPTNSVTGLPNELLLYSPGSTIYSNAELTIKNGLGNDYPFGGTFWPREWNGTMYYTAPGACSNTPVNYCTAGTSASGCTPFLSSVGDPSATSGSGFTVTVSSMEGAKDGLFFYGQAGRQTNSWGNGTSLQCVVTPVKRGGLQTGTGTAGACDGTFSQDLNARWCPTCSNPNHQPVVGQKMQIQCWYRDPFNTSNQTTSLSDALEVDICQ